MNYCDCDLEYADFELQTTPRAKKTHNCQECGCLIFPGQRYYKATGKFDGHMYTYKSCFRCQSLARFIKGQEECFCYPQREMQETIDQLIDDNPPDWTNNLFKAYYCRLKDRHNPYHNKRNYNYYLS